MRPIPLALGFQQQNQHLKMLLRTTTTRGIHSALLVGPSQRPVTIHKTRTDTRLFLEEKRDDNNDAIPSTPLDRPVLSSIDAAIMLVIFAAVGKASHCVCPRIWKRSGSGGQVPMVPQHQKLPTMRTYYHAS
jgi:hypothetical protein